MDFEELDQTGVEAELSALKDRITDLQIENAKIKKVIVANELEEELEGVDMTSVEEQLCVNGINYIADRVKNHDFSDKDIKSFDTLLKALKMIRGEEVPKESRFNKKTSTADLLKIVKSGK